jgi:hypothetical protein
MVAAYTFANQGVYTASILAERDKVVFTAYEPIPESQGRFK